jgi:hypothetical protein
MLLLRVHVVYQLCGALFATECNRQTRSYPVYSLQQLLLTYEEMYPEVSTLTLCIHFYF